MGLIMNQINVNAQWYSVFESLNADGSYTLVVRDHRSDDVFVLEEVYLDEYNAIIHFVETRPELGELHEIYELAG